MEVTKHVREQFAEVIQEFLGESISETRPFLDNLVDRLVNIAETYFSTPTGLIELRGHIGKCAFDFDSDKPLMSIGVSVAKSPENLTALASIGGSITIRGCQLDLERVSSKPVEDDNHEAEANAQMDIEDILPEKEELIFRSEDGTMYAVHELDESTADPGRFAICFHEEYADLWLQLADCAYEPRDTRAEAESDLRAMAEGEGWMPIVCTEPDADHDESEPTDEAVPPAVEEVQEIEPEPDPNSEPEAVTIVPRRRRRSTAA